MVAFTACVWAALGNICNMGVPPGSTDASRNLKRANAVEKPNGTKEVVHLDVTDAKSLFRSALTISYAAQKGGAL